MSTQSERIQLSTEKRKFLQAKLPKYRGRLEFDPAYAPPELRGNTQAWYAYIMTMQVLEKGYFDEAELLATVQDHVKSYFVEEFFSNRAGVILDYLVNDGNNTYKV